MNNKFQIFTACNLNYLPQASILLNSIRKFHDDCRVVLVLVEEKLKFSKEIEVQLSSFDEVLFPEDIWGEDRFVNLFPYSVVEACTAIKGPALAKLLLDGLPVIYLDPDIALFGRLDPLQEYLKSASIVLTPHQLEPVSPCGWGELHDEKVSLLTGVFNFGFLAVSPTAVGVSFSNWWSYRTTEHSYDDAAAGLFTDQKWGNLIPALFPEVAIVRHKGFNVASWNLQERELGVSSDGEYMFGEERLIFFHFTKGAGGIQPVIQKAMGNVYIASLWRWYLETLSSEHKKFNSYEWSYSRYFDQTREIISNQARRSFRSEKQNREKMWNPFIRSQNFKIVRDEH